MSKTAIRVEDTEYPGILVDGLPYELFCELETRVKSFQSLYIREGETDVFIKTGPETAIAGLFSIEEDRLRQLFDYMESTVSKKDGLICYESEVFPRLLALATKMGGKYPILQDNLKTGPLKSTGLSALLRQLHPQHSLDKALQEQIRKHTVPLVQGITESLDASAFSVPKREEASKASLSGQMQDASQRCENTSQIPLPSCSKDNKERLGNMLLSFTTISIY